MWPRIRRIVIISLLGVLLINSLVLADIGIEKDVSAYLIGDYETGEILEGQNIHKPMEIASISKLMSYLIIMDHIKTNIISLDDKIYIDEDIASVKGSSLQMELGESFTVDELLKALMVVSANDATYALAKHVAGTEVAFVGLMNDKARELELHSSIYVNSTGLPDGELQNIMSPEDIFKLSKYIIARYPEILNITTLPYIEVPGRDYKQENTNPLLKDIRGIDGLKTGFTNKAGYCLVSTLMVAAPEEGEDFRLIGIVMGTDDVEKRKEAGGKLIDYGINNYYKKTFANPNELVAKVNIPKSREKEIELYPVRSFTKLVKRGEYIDEDILLDDNIKFPLKAGDVVGQLAISKDGYVFEEIDLTVNRTIKKEGVFGWIFGKVKELLLNGFELVGKIYQSV